MTDDLNETLASARRFQPPATRRDFLGLSAAWSALAATALATLVSLRLPMPSVFPESSSRVKLGPPDRFGVGSATYFSAHRLWLHHADEGYYAISSVCTHLGCVVMRTDEGRYKCPCHGSRFDPMGGVTGGPAPKGLRWVELTLSPEGSLVADTLREVEAGTYVQV